jgi:hypothetical protein
MSDQTAVTIAIVCLYSTGHWIGATVLVAWLLWWLIQENNDPLGVHALVRDMQSYRR